MSGTGDVWDRRSVGQEVSGTIAQEEISRIGDQSSAEQGISTHTHAYVYLICIIYIYIY